MAPKIDSLTARTKIWGFFAFMARSAVPRILRPASFCMIAERQVIGIQTYPPTSPNFNKRLFPGFLIFDSITT